MSEAELSQLEPELSRFQIMTRSWVAKTKQMGNSAETHIQKTLTYQGMIMNCNLRIIWTLH
jgi:hypothetical protein